MSEWTSSSFCDSGACIEVSVGRGYVRLRIRDPDVQEPELLLATTAEWDAFVAGVKAGEFDATANSGAVSS